MKLFLLGLLILAITILAFVFGPWLVWNNFLVTQYGFEEMPLGAALGISLMLQSPLLLWLLLLNLRNIWRWFKKVVHEAEMELFMEKNPKLSAAIGFKVIEGMAKGYTKEKLALLINAAQREGRLEEFFRNPLPRL